MTIMGQVSGSDAGFKVCIVWKSVLSVESGEQESFVKASTQA